MLIFAMLVSSEEDRTKLEQIYIKYKKLMYYIAMDILKDTHESEDVVQNSIIKTAKYIEKIDDINSNKTKHLIVTIVKSTAIDIYRKNRKNNTIDIDVVENVIESKDIPLDDLIIDIEKSEKLAERLAELKNEYADILTLKYYHQFNDNEIANILNLKPGNVRTRLHRAKIALKNLMDKEQYN